MKTLTLTVEYDNDDYIPMLDISELQRLVVDKLDKPVSVQVVHTGLIKDEEGNSDFTIHKAVALVTPEDCEYVCHIRRKGPEDGLKKSLVWR